MNNAPIIELKDLVSDETFYLTYRIFSHRYIFASVFVEGTIVLDIAAGVGYGTDILKKAGAKRVIGGDISEEAANIIASRGQNLYA